MLNPNIDFEKTPFRVQQRLEDWATNDDQSRLAGISSFGAGGSNAHLIVEEYIEPEKPSYHSSEPALVLLSAQNEERLKEQAHNLKDHLSNTPEIDLYDMAYTLQVGRSHLEERMAVIVRDKEDLENELSLYLSGNASKVKRGNVEKDSSDLVMRGKAGAAFLQTAIREKEPETLAQLWVKGAKIDWTLLYPVQRPRKISLPTYPFERGSYWRR